MCAGGGMNTIIIGAGASGLACAISLKKNMPGCEVTVLERLSQAGRKILATGNGRCNLSNTKAEHCDKVLEFFGEIGLVTRTDSEGRIYPYSNQAATVTELLLRECERLGVEIITDCTVTGIDSMLCVESECGIFSADCVVIAAGGRAQSALGSDGSGYELLKKLGHSITPLYPSLVQLTSPSKHPRALSGLRVKCNMKILLDGEAVKSEYGEVLFTDYGLSGIVTMNLSDAVSRNFLSDNPKKCIAELDLIPDMSEEEIEKYINRYKNLDGILGKRLADIISKQAEGNSARFAKYAKHWRLIINGTKGYAHAQITGGGADLSEFDGYASKLCDGVYACGEILDRQFECGGYNLNHAWYSGIKTAEEITEKYNDKN